MMVLPRPPVFLNANGVVKIPRSPNAESRSETVSSDIDPSETSAADGAPPPPPRPPVEENDRKASNNGTEEIVDAPPKIIPEDDSIVETTDENVDEPDPTKLPDTEKEAPAVETETYEEMTASEAVQSSKGDSQTIVGESGPAQQPSDPNDSEKGNLDEIDLFGK